MVRECARACAAKRRTAVMVTYKRRSKTATAASAAPPAAPRACCTDEPIGSAVWHFGRALAVRRGSSAANGCWALWRGALLRHVGGVEAQLEPARVLALAPHEHHPVLLVGELEAESRVGATAAVVVPRHAKGLRI